MIYKTIELYSRYVEVWGKDWVEKLKRARKIGDIGVGGGNLFLYLENLGIERKRIWGWEKDLEMVKKCHELGLQVEYWDVTESFSAEQGGCDVVFCFDVIEHLTKPEKLMKNCAKMLKKGGEVIISTPNPRSISKKLRGKKWYAYQDKTHVRFYEGREIEKMGKMAGLQIIGRKTVSTTTIPFYDKLIGKTSWGGQLLIRMRKK